jgi:hypothetical protein
MADADVAIVGPALSVLDADLAFEVCGPAKTSREARTQQQKYAAAKDARSMLGELLLGVRRMILLHMSGSHSRTEKRSDPSCSRLHPPSPCRPQPAAGATAGHAIWWELRVVRAAAAGVDR